MTCAFEIRDQRRSRQRYAPSAPTLIGLGAGFAVSSGLPIGDLFALICSALTSVVSATLNLFFAFSDVMVGLGIYPKALQPPAAVAPYPSLLYTSSGIAIDAEPAFLWRATLALAVWVLSATLYAELSFRRRQRPSE